VDEVVAPVVEEPSASDRALALRLALGAAACVAAVAVLYVLSVRTLTGQQVEESVVRGAAEVLGDVPWSPTGRIERVSVFTVALAAAVVVGIALARRRPRLALLAAVVVGGSLVSVWLLKYVVLSRPGLVPTDYARGRASFPSGHTAVGMVLATVLVLVLPLRARPWAWVVVGLFGATFGVSTVLSADHRPGDVVAGHLVVLGWTLAAAALLVARRGSTDTADPPPRSVRAPFAVLVGLGLAAALGALVALVAVVVADPARVLQLRAWFFALAVLVLSAEAALATALLLAVFRNVSLDPVRPPSPVSGPAGAESG